MPPPVHRKKDLRRTPPPGPSEGCLEAGANFVRHEPTREILGRETWVYPKSFEAQRFEVGHALDHKPGLGKCVDPHTLAAELCDQLYGWPQNPGHQTEAPASLKHNTHVSHCTVCVEPMAHVCVDT